MQRKEVRTQGKAQTRAQEVSEAEKEAQETRERQESEARTRWEREEQEWRRAPGERDDEVTRSAQDECGQQKREDEYNQTSEHT